ncbi:MAG: hypothetical protein IJN90_04840 [Bacilli bacterium]|nr:hypothetical protein [Bacilli bacterium]
MKMNSIVKYKKELEDLMKKTENNINYFKNFGDAYIPVTLVGHLEIIYEELQKVMNMVNEKEENAVYLEPSSDK